MRTNIPPVELIATERLRTLLKIALHGKSTDITPEEVLALAVHALRSRGDNIPEAVTISRGVRQYAEPAKVIPFRARHG